MVARPTLVDLDYPYHTDFKPSRTFIGSSRRRPGFRKIGCGGQQTNCWSCLKDLSPMPRIARFSANGANGNGDQLIDWGLARRSPTQHWSTTDIRSDCPVRIADAAPFPSPCRTAQPVGEQHLHAARTFARVSGRLHRHRFLLSEEAVLGFGIRLLDHGSEDPDNMGGAVR